MGNNGLPSGDLIEKSSIYGFRFTPSKKNMMICPLKPLIYPSSFDEFSHKKPSMEHFPMKTGPFRRDPSGAPSSPLAQCGQRVPCVPPGGCSPTRIGPQWCRSQEGVEVRNQDIGKKPQLSGIVHGENHQGCIAWFVAWFVEFSMEIHEETKQDLLYPTS